MMKTLTQWAQRFTPVLLAALLAFTSWALVERTRLQRLDSLPASPLNPDFVIENLRLSKLDQSGAAQTLLSAQRMTHIPKTDTSTLEQPRLLNLRADRPPVAISAQRGESLRQSEEIRLFDDVVVTRETVSGLPGLSLRTSQIVVRPDDDTATSDAAFVLRRMLANPVNAASPAVSDTASDTLSGTGFELNNSYRTLVVKQQARGTFLAGRTP